MVVTFDEIKRIAELTQVTHAGFSLVKKLVVIAIDAVGARSLAEVTEKAYLEKAVKLELDVSIEDDFGGNKIIKFCADEPLSNYYATILDYLEAHYAVTSVEVTENIFDKWTIDEWSIGA